MGDRDTVLVPRGYHTVSAPPGYDLYYLNVMAGPTRAWAIANDPDHEWRLHPPPALNMAPIGIDELTAARIENPERDRGGGGIAATATAPCSAPTAP